MNITSKDKIIPFAYKDGNDLRVEPKCGDCFVVLRADDEENEVRGELIEMRKDQLSDGIEIDNINDICSVAKKFMELRPELSEEYPAAVILYNPTKKPHILQWLSVDKFGQIEPFCNFPNTDVPDNGAPLETAPQNRIFYDPVGAIDHLVADVIAEIDALREETKAKEENDKARAEAKKPLIDLINKVQQF